MEPEKRGHPSDMTGSGKPSDRFSLLFVLPLVGVGQIFSFFLWLLCVGIRLVISACTRRRLHIRLTRNRNGKTMNNKPCWFFAAEKRAERRNGDALLGIVNS